MPADPSGVTTDDQGPRRNGGDDPSPAQADTGRSESSPMAPAGDDGNDPRPGDAGAHVAAAGGAASGNGGLAPDGGSAAASSTNGPGGADVAISPGAGTGTPAWPDPAPTATAYSTTEQTTDPRPALGPAALAGAEPPPAPVLTGVPGARGREGRGRHARTDRASRRGLRVNQRLWSIDVWSVFKVSALFYFCLGLIILVAGTLLYNAGRSVGTIDQVESFVTRMGAYGECTPQAEVAEGVEFEEDEDKCAEGEVLVGGFTLDDGTLFRTAAIGGAILVVAGSIGNVLLTVLLNLLNELTGGLRHTVIKEPVARPQSSGSARSPGGGRRRPIGSPRRQLQR